MRAARLRRAARGPGAHRSSGQDAAWPGPARGWRLSLSAVPVWSDSLSDERLGVVRVWATEAGIRRVEFSSEPPEARDGEALSAGPPPAHLAAALAQLTEYLAGSRRAFDVAVDLSAVTPFQQRVYERLLRIPYAQVASYSEVARDIGGEANTARAVGQAVGANPVAIIVPCHRVVASDGRLVGFGGGLPRKAALLQVEGIDVDGTRPSSRVHPEVLRLPL